MHKGDDCLDAGVVERYMSGELDPTAVARCEEHLAICGLCSEIVDGLNRFDVAAVALVPEPDWAAADQQLSDACRRRSSVCGGRHEGAGGWLRRVPIAPALASTLVLVLACTAWLGYLDATRPRTTSVPTPVVPAFPAAAASVIDLNTLRGQQSLPVVDGPDSQRVLALLFFAPLSSEARPTAEIRNGTGELAARVGTIASYDRNGNFCVVVGSNALKPGRYQLVVRGAPDDAGGAREHVFPFIRR